VQASAAGIAIAGGGAIRDGVAGLAADGLLGPMLSAPSAAYGVVYHIELALLFATLAAIGPLVRPTNGSPRRSPLRFGLAQVRARADRSWRKTPCRPAP
jgi:BCD family chlorophyll transporter-like MFS transporter